MLIVDLGTPGFDGVAVPSGCARRASSARRARSASTRTSITTPSSAPRAPASTWWCRGRAWRARAPRSSSGWPVPDSLRPLFDQVVIKELEPDRMRRSGLLVPEGTSDVPPNEGIVLAAGEGPPDLPDFKMPVKPGRPRRLPPLRRRVGRGRGRAPARVPRARDPRRDRGRPRLGRRGDPAGDDRGVLADAVEQRRLALAQEVHAGELRPGAALVAPVVQREAERVERARHVHPVRVVGAVAGGGDDRAEAREVEFAGRVGDERLGSGSSGSGRPRSATSPRSAAEVGAPLVAPCDARGEVVGEARVAAGAALEVAEQVHAERV